MNHLRYYYYFKLGLVIAIFCLTNCSNLQYANYLASRANLEPKTNYTKYFLIKSYVRSNQYLDPKKPIFVYIEGDGRAWLSKTRLSSDPTPNNPLALKLAALDHQPNVIYIARPCQFISHSLDRNCHSKYWSEARYSQPVITAIEAVITNFQAQIQSMSHAKLQPKIHLIGYSGGAAIAGLIASHRTDIASIRSIAGNLDHDAVSDFQHTTKLNKSLNLLNFTKHINQIPQDHYIGTNDQIIPSYIVARFVAKVNANAPKCCAHYILLPGIDHYHGWENIWQKVNTTLPICNNHG